MLRRIFLTLLRYLSPALALSCLALILPRFLTALYAAPRIYTSASAPARRVAIVLGAGLRRDGSPTPVLRDRVETAVDLYRQGKASLLLMSGTAWSENYDEPAAMKEYALLLGVPESAILLDPAGTRTLETCRQALDKFDVHEAIIVTQQFHLPRALYLCSTQGIDAIGVAADRRVYSVFSNLVWNLRELPATLAAILGL